MYLAISLIMSSCWLAWNLWTVRGYIRNGKVPYWRGLNGMRYVERQSNPAGFWAQLALALVVGVFPLAYLVIVGSGEFLHWGK
jgi:hypothetical protein